MLTTHLPALQVVIPLVSAPVCLLLRNPRHAWTFALTISWVALAIAINLAGQVHASGTVSYAIGAWAVPWGIEYRVDMASVLMILIITTIGAIVRGEEVILPRPETMVQKGDDVILATATGMAMMPFRLGRL